MKTAVSTTYLLQNYRMDLSKKIFVFLSGVFNLQLFIEESQGIAINDDSLERVNYLSILV